MVDGLLTSAPEHPTLGRLLLWDPFFDPGCWANCTDNVLLVHTSPDVANGIQDAERLFLVVAALSLGAVCPQSGS